MSSRICVVGTGYSGIACALGFASLGWSVACHDPQSDRIDDLQRGISPFRETGVEESLRAHLASGALVFERSLEAAARDSDVIVIASETPSRDDGSADLSALDFTLFELSKLEHKSFRTIAIRSTVPPGTCDRIARETQDWANVVCAPEFLNEGSALADFLNPARIVVGTESTAAALPYVRLFEKLQKPVVFTTRCNAELIRACANAFVAMKVSFANEVASLCDATGAGAADVLRGIGYDQRIGFDSLAPGIGFGGPSFEKDLRSINYVAQQMNTGSQLFSAMLRTNKTQPRRIVALMEAACGTLEGLEIGVWGLAPEILEELSQCGARTVVYDPGVHVMTLPAGSVMAASALEAAQADALLVLAEWPEFAQVDPADVKAVLRRGIVIDAQNVLDPEPYKVAGLAYYSIGRPSAPSEVERSTAVI
jgi:UDPglucose 6-dehydrogenase